MKHQHHQEATSGANADPQQSLSLLVPVCLIIVAITLIFKYYKQAHSYWSNRNVNTPPTLPIFGNSLIYFTKPRRELEVELAQTYGKLYGYYSGSQPILVVADAEVLKNVCVTNFSNFKNHNKLGGLATSFQKNFLIMQKGDKWKRMRSAMSTTFTSSKMRRMFSIIDGCANDMVKSIDEKIGSDSKAVSATIDAAQTSRLYSLDAISSCAYGFSMSRQASLNTTSLSSESSSSSTVVAGSNSSKNSSVTRDSLSDVIKGIFTISKLRFYANYLLPHGILEVFGLSLLSEDGIAYLAAKLQTLMEKRRRESKKNYNDYLQLLMEAHVDDEFDFSELDSHENHHLGATSETLRQQHDDLLKQFDNSNNSVDHYDYEDTHQNKNDSSSSSAATTKSKSNTSVKLPTSLRGQLTDHEILCNAVMLLMVGTETSQALTSELLFILAYHQDAQERLYEEVSLIKTTHHSTTLNLPSFDYDEIAANKYLDAVISEALRLMPPVLYMDRMTESDYCISKYNVTVEKGTPVNLAFFAVQHDPDYWPDPYHFDPDRFMPENRHKIVPGAYCPFGLGPRACIGMRFSLAEIKVAIAKLVTAFKFAPAPNTVYPPAARLTTFFQNQSIDLRVTVSRRHASKN